MPTSSDLTSDALWVVCLCAQWCNVCEQYRRNFTQVQASVQADHANVQFLWLDIEDEAEVLDPLDVDNFPTVLLAVGDTPRFFGTITPQPQTLERLVRMTLQDPAASGLAAPGVKELVARVQAWRARAVQPARLG